ncbi:MAG: hypothetical protein US74_C0005G0001 [Parcubacteria group bacterium GW2011_GWA2_38_13]|nr:MAG: hypothetical protein US74_C0005G0001 [Parcubacteria group bacterium GW2011_GWA2_38_13]
MPMDAQRGATTIPLCRGRILRRHRLRQPRLVQAHILRADLIYVIIQPVPTVVAMIRKVVQADVMPRRLRAGEQ